MKRGRFIVCDALIALAVIAGLNACDKEYNSHSLVSLNDSILTPLK